VVVWLEITGLHVGWADPAHVDWADDPYAPHVTKGTTVRLGTAAGFLYREGLDVLAIGATVAAGQRFGRLTLESEFDYLKLTAESAGIRIGDAERLGVIARFDVLRLGPRWVGANSMLAVYAEGGAAVAWNHWYPLGSDEPMRIVPDDTKRVEPQLGFGLLLDHRLQEPIGFPHRIGWFLGWRLAFAPEDPAVPTRCGGAVCRVVEPMTERQLVNRSMLFQSSLAVTW
jgi:hypothetical protein